MEPLNAVFTRPTRQWMVQQSSYTRSIISDRDSGPMVFESVMQFLFEKTQYFNISVWRTVPNMMYSFLHCRQTYSYQTHQSINFSSYLFIKKYFIFFYIQYKYIFNIYFCLALRTSWITFINKITCQLCHCAYIIIIFHVFFVCVYQFTYII